MSRNYKKILFWIIFGTLMLAVILFLNWRIEKKNEKSENNPNQKTPKPPNNDDPTDNPPPVDTENWWLTDEEIEHAYQEIRKENNNSPEIQLVSPSIVRVIQEGGEISEDLKKAKIIFFPINNSENHETSDSGNHWTLLVLDNRVNIGAFAHYNSAGSNIPTNAQKLAEKLCEKLEVDKDFLPPTIYNDYECPQQTNGADCGVYVIAYTRFLVNEWKKKNGPGKASFKEQDLIFTIAEERQKLKEAGFPKKGTPGKDYDISDDVEYLEKEEELISQWWPSKDNPYHPLRKCVRNNWNLDRESGEPFDYADNFKEFSKKVRLLSGKINQKNTEKEKITQIYRLKKILKACSLPLEEYKKTKSFNGKDNFREDKITAEESQFVRENINKETVKKINDLYNSI